MNLKIRQHLFTLALFLRVTWLFSVTPEHLARLHFTNVYFEDELVPSAIQYKLCVYADSIDAFKDKSLIQCNSRYPSFRVNDLSWGRSYVWRLTAVNKKGEVAHSSPLRTFSIIPHLHSVNFDTTKVDVRINSTGQNAGGYFAIDCMKGIYDRKGSPVWFMPMIEGYVTSETELRDLKMTKEGTLTFLADNIPLETDLNGNILWKVSRPFVYKNDTLSFHHELRKTDRGTYFVLANRKVYRRVLYPFERQVNRETISSGGEIFTRADIPIAVELDQKGEVVWAWDSNSYLTDGDLNYRKGPDSFPLVNVHANALAFSDDLSKIYIGFRDLNRVIRIDKKSGQVEMSYGHKYPSGEARYGNNLFRQQHDASPTKRNSILIFNNNGPRGGFGVSSILELSDRPDTANNLVVWQFTLDFDTLTKGRSGSGGNVNELPGGNLMLCAGQLNRIFEVTKEKEIVWDAFLYKVMKGDTAWTTLPNYRASWLNGIFTDGFFTGRPNIKRKKNQAVVSLPIYNVSEKEDIFSFELKDKTGRTLETGRTKVCLPHDETSLVLNLPSEESTGVILTIVSVNNSVIRKKILLK